MEDNLQIIVTEEYLLSSLDKLIYRSYDFLMRPDYGSEILDSALPFIAKANPVLVNSGKYYAALLNGKLIACGGWSFESPGSKEIEEGTAHIRHFATLPEYCGKGVGRALYNFSKQEAQKLGVRRFECYSSLNAVKFYEALGFSILREEKMVLPKNIILPCFLMQSQIADL